MINVEGQIALQISIGPKEDFLMTEDFEYLEILENAGGLRPVMTLSFSLKREDVIPYLNSGNIVTIMFGIEQPISEVYQFEITGDDKTKAYAIGSKVVLSGAWYNHSFTNTKRSDGSPNSYSIDVLKKLAEKHKLTLVTNVEKTADKCDWHQNGITDWSYFDRICRQAYINDDTFIIYALDNSHLYFYDMRKKIQQGANWNLAVAGMGKGRSNVINIGTYRIDGSYQGTNAILAGKNVQTVGYDLDSGNYVDAQYTLKTFTSLNTTKININSTDCLTYNYEITTDEEHPNAISARNNNIRNGILFSSYCCYVPIAHQMIPFKLLDFVQLSPAETDKDAEGFYFITGIARCFKDNKYTCNLTLNRESANGLRSESLEVGDN